MKQFITFLRNPAKLWHLFVLDCIHEFISTYNSNYNLAFLCHVPYRSKKKGLWHVFKLKTALGVFEAYRKNDRFCTAMTKLDVLMAPLHSATWFSCTDNSYERGPRKLFMNYVKNHYKYLYLTDKKALCKELIALKTQLEKVKPDYITGLCALSTSLDQSMFSYNFQVLIAEWAIDHDVWCFVKTGYLDAPGKKPVRLDFLNYWINKLQSGRITDFT